jgi:hypothetical protein
MMRAPPRAALAGAAACVAATIALTVALNRRKSRGTRAKRLLNIRALGWEFFLSEVSMVPLPPPFHAWEGLASQLPSLNRHGRIRAAIEGLPLLHDLTSLSLPELRRARVLLGALVTSYVNGHAVPWNRLEPTAEGGSQSFSYSAPAPTPPSAIDAAKPLDVPIALPDCLSLPWRVVSERLGMPPILTATDLDLWNRGTMPTSLPPAAALSSFRQLVSITGTQSERSFHALPYALQLVLAPLLPALLGVPQLSASDDVRAMQALCERVRAALDDATALLPFVYSGVRVVHHARLGHHARPPARTPARSNRPSELRKSSRVALRSPFLLPGSSFPHRTSSMMSTARCCRVGAREGCGCRLHPPHTHRAANTTRPTHHPRRRRQLRAKRALRRSPCMVGLALVRLPSSSCWTWL